MHTSARTFGYTFAASLGLHGVLLLAAAALMTVMPALDKGKRTAALPLVAAIQETIEESTAPAPQEQEVTFVTLEPVPEEKKVPPPLPEPPLTKPAGERMVVAPEDQPALAPLNSQTPFISNRDMRAASTRAPRADADPNLIDQDGHRLPMLSLTSSSFSDGSTAESARAVPAKSAELSPPEVPADPVQPPDTPPPPPPPPPAEDHPIPDPASVVKTSDPLAPAPADKPPDTPALREPAVEPLALEKVSPPRPKPLDSPPRDPVARQSTPSPSPGKTVLSSVKTKSMGAISHRGSVASVDARDTPEGRFMAAVRQRVGLIWNQRLSTVRGLAGAGVVEVEYDIDVEGRVSNVRLVNPGTANPILEDVCLTAIIKVRLPVPPREMQREIRDPLTGGRLRCKFTFYRL